MPKNYIELPDDYSLEIPSYNLVLNVSPFPSFDCIKCVSSAEEITPSEDVFWVRITTNLFCCYERKNFSSKCPCCGRLMNEEVNEDES